MSKHFFVFAAGLAAAACTAYEARPLDRQAVAQQFLDRALADAQVRQGFAAAGRPFPTAAWQFEDLWCAALSCQPELAVARAQLAVAAAESLQAAERINPRLSFTPEWSANADPGVSPWVLGLALAWPLELGGQRTARLDLATQKQVQTGLVVAAQLWQAREQLLGRCLQYEFAMAHERQLADEAEVADQVAALIEQRLAAGAIAVGQASAARLDRQQALVDVALAAQATLQARRDLAMTVGVPTAALAAIALPTTFARPDPGERSLVELRQLALQARPDLQQQLADYEVKEAELRLAVRRQYPDLELGPGYQYDQGQHKVLLGVAFDLPLFHNQDGAIRVAMAAREASAATFAARQANAFGEIELGFAAVGSLRQEIVALSELQRLRRADRERVAARFAAGEDDALTVATARRAEAASQRELLQARERQAMAAVHLEQSIGMPLAPSMPPVASSREHDQAHP